MNQSTRPAGQSQAEQEEMRIGWKMAGIGMQVGTEVIAGCLLGWLFDRWRGQGNIGLIVGASVGIVVAMWSLIKNTLKLNRQLEQRAPTKGRGTPLTDSSGETDDWHENDDDWDKDNKDDWNRTAR